MPTDSRFDDLDIYTRKPMENPSMEHIIHNFLGGSLQSPLIDRKLNSHYGSGIDADFCTQLRPYLTRLDLRSDREKNRPPPAMDFTAEPDKQSERLTWTLRPGGVPELRSVDRKISAKTVDGGITISAYIRGGESLSDEKMVTMIWTAALRDKDLSQEKKQWLQANKDVVIAQIREKVSAEHTTEVTPVIMRTPLNILEPSFLRSVAKIACNYFAHYNRAAFLDDGCNRIRKYVKNGRGIGHLLMCTAAAPEVSGMRHGVVFQVHGNGDIVGAVTLFGSLHFLVNVGHSPIEKLLRPKSMYTVDQAGQEAAHVVPEWDLPPFDHRSTLLGTVNAVGMHSLHNFIQTVETASLTYSLSKDKGAAINPLVTRLVENLFLNQVISPRRPQQVRCRIRRARNGQWVVTPRSRRYRTRALAESAV